MKPEHVREILFNVFQRHCVALRVQFTKQDKTSVVQTYSGFVMSVDDHWFLITAGHCVDEIAKATEQGYTLESELIDNLSTEQKYQHALPFDFETAEPVS